MPGKFASFAGQVILGPHGIRMVPRILGATFLVTVNGQYLSIARNGSYCASTRAMLLKSSDSIRITVCFPGRLIQTCVTSIAGALLVCSCGYLTVMSRILSSLVGVSL